jgi:hypothetical protein
VNIFRFRDRVGVLDERSHYLLKTVAWVGGYVTPERGARAWNQKLSNQGPCPVKGFEHTLETIRTRLLTVNFYLEAIRWPAKFVLDHKQKISKLFEVVAEPALLPYRGSKPYLWQDLIFQRPSGEVIFTMVDHFGRHPYRQLYRHLKRFAPILGPDDLRLMIVVSSEHREQVFRRKLNHTRLQRLLEQQGLDLPVRDMVTIYRVRRAVPVVRPLITNGQQLRELRAQRLANRGIGDSE